MPVASADPDPTLSETLDLVPCFDIDASRVPPYIDTKPCPVWG
jgi:hypothetical protein